MGDASKFNHISPKKSGHVTYGDNNKGRILKIGKIGVIMEENLCRNLPIGGRATRDSRDACSTKGIRAESPPTFI